MEMAVMIYQLFLICFFYLCTKLIATIEHRCVAHLYILFAIQQFPTANFLSKNHFEPELI